MSDERRSKDQRQWMRFPIDMHRDPKVTRLTDAQFRVFFEMNGEARLERNDGVFGKDDAEFRWPAEDLAALCRSHPTAPLVRLVGDTYVIRVYSQHQLTEADRERLAEVARENGRKGGRPRNPETQNNPAVTQTEPSGTQGKADQESESESESDQETDDYTNTRSVSPEGNRARNARLTDQGIISIQKSVELHSDIEMTPDEATQFAAWIIAKSSDPVKAPAAYVRGAVKREPMDPHRWMTQHRRHLKAVGNE